MWWSSVLIFADVPGRYSATISTRTPPTSITQMSHRLSGPWR